MNLRQFAILCSTLTFFGHSLSAADAGKVRLFVLSGQSNMQGVAPDAAFTPAVKQVFPNDDVVVVHYAEGGTPIRRWWQGWTGPHDVSAAGADQAPGDLYVTLMTKVQTALAGRTPDTVVLVWMQGERDAKSGLSAFYEQALKGLIQAVRDDLKQPDAAVVIGRLSDHQKGNEHWDAVRAIQEKVATQDPRGAWVDTDDLNGEKNDLHCTKDGFVELGRRFAAKSVELLARPNPTAIIPAEFKRTGWNAMARQQFMHPPVLTYSRLAGAANYRCRVSWIDAHGAAQTKHLESALPEFDLAKMWQDMRPATGVGKDGLPAHDSFQVSAEAVDSGGKPLASVVSACQWEAPFNGPYRPAKCAYGESAAKTVACLLQKNLTGEGGSFPVLMNAAYIRLLTSYLRVYPQGELAGMALQQAKQYGQDLLKTSTPADWVYAHMPMSHLPNYHLPSGHQTHMFQVGRGAMAGMAYLDLYAATQDKVWLDAALRIAATLKKNQLPDGRWPFRVEPRTGTILEDYTSDQAEAILLFDKLVRNHGQEDLHESLDKAVRWMLENPCVTFQWQQQWDDLGTFKPYENLEHYDTALFIEYLLRHATPQNAYEALVGKLARYIEDHFVEWQPCEDQITPGVREQYVCYPVIDWHCAHYIRVCMAFHAKTNAELWLQKARALADTLTVIQHPSGFYPTWMKHKPSKDAPGELKDINYADLWPNCSSYSAEILLRLGEHLKATAAK
ncbi:MAG: sialate O-acetylesterase [Planctomycetota bacterium]